MKLIITLFTMIAITVSNHYDSLDSNAGVINLEVLFDGSEGNLHFLQMLIMKLSLLRMKKELSGKI